MKMGGLHSSEGSEAVPKTTRMRFELISEHFIFNFTVSQAMLPPSSQINHSETRIQRIQVPVQVPILKPVYVEVPYPVYVPIPGPNRLQSLVSSLPPETFTQFAPSYLEREERYLDPGKHEDLYSYTRGSAGSDDDEDEDDDEEEESPQYQKLERVRHHHSKTKAAEAQKPSAATQQPAPAAQTLTKPQQSSSNYRSSQQVPQSQLQQQQSYLSTSHLPLNQSSNFSHNQRKSDVYRKNNNQSMFNSQASQNLPPRRSVYNPQASVNNLATSIEKNIARTRQYNQSRIPEASQEQSQVSHH